MKNYNNRYQAFGHCHYCVCTVCAASWCPYGNHSKKARCRKCYDNWDFKPCLECYKFVHYLKHIRFKVKRKVKAARYVNADDVFRELQDLKALVAQTYNPDKRFYVIDGAGNRINHCTLDHAAHIVKMFGGQIYPHKFSLLGDVD